MNEITRKLKRGLVTDDKISEKFADYKKKKTTNDDKTNNNAKKKTANLATSLRAHTYIKVHPIFPNFFQLLSYLSLLYSESRKEI